MCSLFVVCAGVANHGRPEVPGGTMAESIIDCQSHLFCPRIVELMERRDQDPRVVHRNGSRWVVMGDWIRRILPHHMDVDAKLAAMDAAGISQAALSINDPGPECFPGEEEDVARLANDFVAGICRRHPRRFLGVAVLPLPNVPAAMHELDRCVNELGFRGWLLYTNIAGRFPDEPVFRPLLARSRALGIPVLLHPARPVTIEFVKDYELTGTLGNMFEDTIALARLIVSGLLDDLPGLKLVCPHLGGALPYLIGRLDHQVGVLKRGPQHLACPPGQYLRQVWFDLVSPLPAAMRMARELLTADRLLFASDHPWVEPRLILDCLAEAGFSADERRRVLCDNARELFQIGRR